VKKRTRARELALQFLYQADLVGKPLDEIDEFLREEERDVETRRFAHRLIVGTLERRGQIDEVIQDVAQNWSISRMAVIDRNVLRLATHELLHCQDIPPKVAINEAIEIGKRYSTQNSGAFINGILDKIMNRPEGRAAQGAKSNVEDEIDAELEGESGSSEEKGD
jgi:N utilization substance protein B